MIKNKGWGAVSDRTIIIGFSLAFTKRSGKTHLNTSTSIIHAFRPSYPTTPSTPLPLPLADVMTQK